MRVYSAMAAAAALALASAPAVAQGANEDVKCLLVANLFVKAEKDPAKRQVAVLASYYYLGRIDARIGGQQLGAAMKAQAATLTQQTAGPVMTGCAKRLQSAGMAIQTLSKELNGPK